MRAERERKKEKKKTLFIIKFEKILHKSRARAGSLSKCGGLIFWTLNRAYKDRSRVLTSARDN